MTETLYALLGALVGGALAYAVAVARSSARTDAAVNRRVAELAAQRDDLANQFKVLADEALVLSQNRFLDLADQRLKRAQQEGTDDLEKRQEAVRQMVEPVAKALDEVKRQTGEAEKARIDGQAALREQVLHMVAASEKLDKKTTDFINTLRRSDVRGNWGEVQLRRVVELAGMLPHVDFEEQDSVRDSDGKLLRPDMTVRLAGGRTVVVDSKVALSALIEAFETDDEDRRAERLRAHADQVRKHVNDLASKKYWDQFASAPEFVVMFVPSEAFYQAAVEQDASLQEYAFSKNVMIATPTTLVAMLRTVAHAWKEDALAKNAQLVLATGKELYDRLVTMGGHLAKVGRALESAGKAYDQTVASMESRVLVTARKFGEMQHIGVELESPEQIQLDVREIAAPELADDADEG